MVAYWFTSAKHLARQSFYSLKGLYTGHFLKMLGLSAGYCSFSMKCMPMQRTCTGLYALRRAQLSEEPPGDFQALAWRSLHVSCTATLWSWGRILPLQGHVGMCGEDVLPGLCLLSCKGWGPSFPMRSLRGCCKVGDTPLHLSTATVAVVLTCWGLTLVLLSPQKPVSQSVERASAGAVVQHLGEKCLVFNLGAQAKDFLLDAGFPQCPGSVHWCHCTLRSHCTLCWVTATRGVEGHAGRNRAGILASLHSSLSRFHEGRDISDLDCPSLLQAGVLLRTWADYPFSVLLNTWQETSGNVLVQYSTF